MDHPTSGLKEIIASSFTAHPALTAALSGTIFLSLFLSILPPLVLQRAIDALADGKADSSLLLFWGLLYFILTALSGLSEGIRETLITISASPSPKDTAGHGSQAEPPSCRLLYRPR